MPSASRVSTLAISWALARVSSLAAQGFGTQPHPVVVPAPTPIQPIDDIKYLSDDRLAGRMTGSPKTCRYCLGKSPPARSPRPAATTTAATLATMFCQSKMTSRHGLARRGRAANLHIARPVHSRSKCGSFALQHLRIRANWLNSMQPGYVA